MTTFVRLPDNGKVTPNGEITYDWDTELYTSWDETCADTIYIGYSFGDAINAFKNYTEFSNNTT